MPKVNKKPIGCVIGIDPSLTGSSISIQYQHGSSHTVRFSSEPTGTDVRARMKRYGTYLARILNVLPTEQPTCITIEGYSMGSKGSALTGICEFGGLLREQLCVLYPTADIYEVAPQSLKKFITGKGNSKGKTEVISAIARKYGMEFATDDEYDAYGLGRIALCLAGYAEPETNAQREVIDKLLNPPVKKPRRRSK